MQAKKPFSSYSSCISTTQKGLSLFFFFFSDILRRPERETTQEESIIINQE
jgi:hypothetical protein